MVQRSGQPIEVGSLSHCLQGNSYIPGGYWDIFHQQYYKILQESCKPWNKNLVITPNQYFLWDGMDVLLVSWGAS